MESDMPSSLFAQTVGLRTLNSDADDVEIFVSIGGWSFSDNSTATQTVFSDIAASEANRNTFAKNLVNFLKEYGFDGVGFDWEYPVAPDRRGKKEDTKNYILLLQAVREALNNSGGRYGISFTAPSSYWYLQWFDLPGMIEYADWINLMSRYPLPSSYLVAATNWTLAYDLHGAWDSTSAIGSIGQAHTNLTEIKSALDLLWRMNIPPKKVIMGLGFYGRSFTLSHSSCATPGCPFSEAAAPGICSKKAGILAYFEIMDILDKQKPKVIWDKANAVKYFQFGAAKDQWVSYDDKDTFTQKVEYADVSGQRSFNQQTFNFQPIASKPTTPSEKVLLNSIIIMDLVDTVNVNRLPPDRRRTPMTAEDKAAFLRAAAAADPASVTRADKNQIFGQPPPDEEDGLCQAKIGMTMEELRRKVMSDSESLTEPECDILRYGSTYEWGQPKVSRRQWSLGFLPDEEYRLASQVLALLANDHDDEISRRAGLRAKAFENVKKERYEESIKKRDAEEAAKLDQELSPEEKVLYLRIIADPTSATRADKNQVYEKPPPDEEDRLCKDRVGITMGELRHKALSNPDAMTEDECNVLIRGVMKREKSNGRCPLWKLHLVEDDRKLYHQVGEILYTQEDTEVQCRAHHRRHDFDDVIEERRKRKRQQQIDERAAKWRARQPRWVRHMFDANLNTRRWGFVIFRTAYGEGTEYKCVLFESIYGQHALTQLHHCWEKAAGLSSPHYPLTVSDPLLEGANIDTLRQRFKTMREQGEILERIATDCFLVAYQAALDDPYLTSKTPYKPKAPGDPDPWQSTITVRAINPDYDASVPIASEEDLAGYEGEITIPLPKVFDWLYYCFLAKSEDWETRYKLVRGGPAEMMVSMTLALFDS
ncbi:hypothetical protein ACHAPE_000526 [Trichoderma viride]